MIPLPRSISTTCKLAMISSLNLQMYYAMQGLAFRSVHAFLWI
jgi:hypothetical protein